MVWWEAVLSPALQVLFDKLSSGDITEYLQRWNFNELLLEKLKIAYFTNTAVLDDAEEKQYNNPAVETWLDMLKDAVHEAEDILDELATEALRCNLEANSQTITNQVRNWNFIPTSFNPFNEGIESRIEKIIDKLEYVAKQKDVLGLKGDGRGRSGIIQRAPTTPLLIESHVFGRDNDKEEIIKLLVADDEGTYTEVCVIPILGMGGLGKTTLAQFVYNDKRVDEHFDLKAWACVSDDFDVISITKGILESATKTPFDTMNLELLQDNLKRRLNKKKFLVVLDDVWNENYDNWNNLRIPFMVGAQGSKIIVTTRNEEVLSVMNALPPYRLKEMADDACWSLFLHHAFGNRNLDAHPDLKAIGRGVVTKCKGLPLAAKTLGGLLGSKLDTNHWNDILNSNIWDLPPKKSNILPALRLSYHHLPANLKRCFAYCSIFPKDYEFDRKKIVLLWMAEGFVQQVEENKRMEEVGDEYFGDLLSRSLFQESARTRSRYVMHDLINDLAQFVSRKMCIRLEEKLECSREGTVFKKARHLSYIRGKYDVFKRFEVLYDVKWLRTFLPLPLVSPYEARSCYLTNKVPHDLLPKLRCLRVLSLSGYCFDELPDSIGNLRHLRYLDLSQTAIKRLPESICMLYNLQTLILYDCHSLAELPTDMGNLINLRHLDISGSGLQGLPLRMGKLRSLQTLPEFIVGCESASGIGELGDFLHLLGTLSISRSENVGDAWEARQAIKGCESASGIGELRDLLHLRGKLSISRLENVGDAWDARQANLINKQFLDELVMEWSSFDESRNDRVETDVLEMLRPHQKLEKVTINRYGGKRFPTWIGDPSFCNIVFLSFSDCKRCMSLPPLGQLRSLKKLCIKGMTGVKSVGVEFYGDGFLFVKPFPSLEILSFKEMLEWEDWSSSQGEEEIEGFPSLCELYIESCPKLQGKLPYHLPSLTKLVIHESEQLASSLPRFSNLRDMDLNGCDEVLLRSALDLTSLASLNIGNISELMHLPKELMQCLTQLERLQIVDCCELTCLWLNEVGLQQLTSLRRLVIRNCPLLVSLLEEEQQLPSTLEYLELEDCHSLEKLPHAFHSLASLGELTIKECPKLVSFPETDLPPMLRGLEIRGCGLESLPDGVIHNSNTSLELYISGCYVLTSFPRGGELLPTTFKGLTINHCPNLESLPEGMMHRSNMSLKVLEIFDCSSLTSFPRGNLPATLKTLTICNCANLESLPEMMTHNNMSLESFRIENCTNLKSLPNGLCKLTYLDYLEIDGCPGLVSFPEGGFPSTSLRKVYIINCENLKSLPDRLQNLTSLQELHISDCPHIVSFPEGGLPTNLLSLEIKDCVNIRPLSEWGLHRLISLQKFSISGSCSNLASFPEWLLPPTLTALNIGRLPNLETLSSWLRNLTSLEDLKITECHKLCSLPIEGLPATLSRLEIRGCHLLKKQCEKDWPKLDHIPCIMM